VLNRHSTNYAPEWSSYEALIHPEDRVQVLTKLPVGGRSGNYCSTTVYMGSNGFEHGRTLVLAEPRNFACDSERGKSIHASADEQFDQALETVEVNLAVIGEWCR
jgi:hypothetical protein